MCNLDKPKYQISVCENKVNTGSGSTDYVSKVFVNNNNMNSG